jgi:cytochrome c oxidase assembly factor CtaG
VFSVSGGALGAVVLFNGVMVWWHIPGIYDWQMNNSWSTEVLMAPSFILAGSLFWRVLFGGRDGLGNPRLVVQALTVLSTAFVMLVMAMWMSIGASAPWYASTVALHGGVLALRDQHYAAGVLWVCGDLWAIPALVVVALRVVNRRGGASAMTNELLGK